MRGAQGETANPGERPGRTIRQSDNDSGNGEHCRQRGGGHIQFGPHDDRRDAGDDIAGDPADAAGNHTKHRCGYWRHAISERLGRPEHRECREAGGIGPFEQFAFPPRSRGEPRDQRGREDHRGDPRVVQPERGRAQQHVAQAAPADAGDKCEERHGDERLPQPSREQGAGQSENGDPGQVKGGGKDRRCHSAGRCLRRRNSNKVPSVIPTSASTPNTITKGLWLSSRVCRSMMWSPHMKS